ncbi:hypothetical protein PF005_g12213 [Phytophthora fragariae]|uniref:Ubiquitin-like protease family profile domain-containing protein n=2 Tax=Phytophthora fragariae TaxID=53985 RepID=A0A6A3EUS0_9STRA|nr:hypothetical protein PF009_g13732 [Phytophthora fragariae]KAE9137962.1 hypothetical protein PF007_g1593 [Phytophthora fragariae]KAE9143254.1 hypothetical protein PF006_g11694 [Phytophthora fragariae]KAE9208449.1 hypothetical protein PF005_g12213 [Phytophthora fragariae]
MQGETEEVNSSVSSELEEVLREIEDRSENGCEVRATTGSITPTQLGVQLGTELSQLGTGPTDLVDLGDQPELGTDVERLCAETAVAFSATESNEAQARSIDLTDANDAFELESPPKTKGRPKQKPKVVKARRNQVIAMIQEDLEMHDKQLSLLSLYKVLENNPTFNSSREKLIQFKPFTFLNKQKPPIAHEISRLPVTKPFLRPEDIVRIFPMDLITKYMAKVTAYQRKHSGVRELDIALEIVGLGVFANSTVALMKNGTRHSKLCKRKMPVVLKNIPLLSNKAQVLDLTAKECLTDEIMHLSLTKKFGTDPNIVVFAASTLGVVLDGHIAANQSDIQLTMSGLSKEIVLFPVNCNRNHWCSVMINLDQGKVFIYDSSASSYLVSLRAVAQKLITLLPNDVRPSTRLQVYESGLGIQVDNYNCGVYVLLAFEIFCGAEPLSHVDKKTLQCLRYRYFRMCAQD